MELKIQSSLLITKDAEFLSVKFSSPTIIIEADLANKKDSWIKAGYLYQFISIPKIHNFVRVGGIGFFISFHEPRLIELNPFAEYGGYHLQFRKSKWISQLNLKIYECVH